MSQLRITLLDVPRATIGGDQVFLKSHIKAQALLYYLATTRRVHYRNELASLFWADVPDVQALKNLRNILPVLRQRVGNHLLITHHTVAFNKDTSYWLDVEAFETLLTATPAQTSTHALREATNLYHDEFLSGFQVRQAPLFEDWMLMKRERLCHIVLDALHTLATRYLEQHDYHAALGATRRILHIAPWHENAHQQQMTALFELGQRSSALAQYHACCRTLAAEFDVAPNAETVRIYEQIKTASAGIGGEPISSSPAVSVPLPNGRSSPPAFGTIRNLPNGTTTAPHLVLAMNNDSTFLAVTEIETVIRLEYLPTGNHTQWHSGHNAAITALSFSPDGRLLASASADQTVRLWHIPNGGMLTAFVGHDAAITALSFSPDGQLLASSSVDRTVRLWQVAGSMDHTILQMHQQPVIHVAFIGNSNRIISVDTSRVVQIRDVSQHAHTSNWKYTG